MSSHLLNPRMDAVQSAVPLMPPTRRSGILRIFRQMDVIVALALIFMLLLIVCSIFAPLLVSQDPQAQTLSARLQPPGESGHVLGADQLGRDVLSRVMYGGRISLLVAVSAVVVAGTIGVVIGLVGGFVGGKIDAFLTWIANVQLAFPLIILAVALAAVLGGSTTNVIIILVVTSWVSYARLVRAETLSLKQREFVVAAHALGATTPRILLRHLLPNIYKPLLVLAALEVSRMVILEAALSFLGIGVPASVPTWGSMISEGKEYLEEAWWISTIPGLLLTLTVLSVNIISDWANDRL